MTRGLLGLDRDGMATLAFTVVLWRLGSGSHVLVGESSWEVGGDGSWA